MDIVNMFYLSLIYKHNHDKKIVDTTNDYKFLIR